MTKTNAELAHEIIVIVHGDNAHAKITKILDDLVLKYSKTASNAGWEVERLRAEGAYDNGRDGWR